MSRRFHHKTSGGPVPWDRPSLQLALLSEFYITSVCWERKTLIRNFYNKPSSFILYS